MFNSDLEFQRILKFHECVPAMLISALGTYQHLYLFVKSEMYLIPMPSQSFTAVLLFKCIFQWAISTFFP